MTILGISHITYIVRNLDRMSDILSGVLGAEMIYDSGKATYSLSEERYFLIGGIWIAVMVGDAPLERSYRHLALQVALDDLPLYQARALALGLEIRTPRSRTEGEGQSLYFYDFDNHLFELHAGTLNERLVAYAARDSG